MSQPNLFDTPDPEKVSEVPAQTPDVEVVTYLAEHGIPDPSENLEIPAPRVVGSTKPKRVTLIDGHALAYRSYFALQRSSGTLTTSKGEPVQAVYGFLKTLMRHVKDGVKKGIREGAVIVVFDPPVKTFRHEAFENYKAGRADTPDDLHEQVRKIKRLVDLMGLTRLEEPGYEADDVIGTLATRAEQDGMTVRILTSDRDAYQLLTDNVKVISSDDREVGPAEVFEKYGVRVDQWVDYRSLTGDSSDNIPGAKGIGPKGAQKLLERYGNLDWILEHLDEVEPVKEAQKIRDSFANVLMSKELSRIVTDMDFEVDFIKANVFAPQEGLREALSELEFFSLIKDMNLGAIELEAMQPKAAQVINTLEWQKPDAKAVWGFTLSSDFASSAELTALSFADLSAENAVREAAAPFFEALRDLTEVHAFDAKSLAVNASMNGVMLEPGDDPLLMAYTLDTTNINASIISKRYLEHDWAKDAVGQAAGSAALVQKLSSMFTAEQKKLYENLEIPTSKVLARMEASGIRIDAAQFKAMSDGFQARIKELEAELWTLAGEEFNLNSRDQLERILYDKLELASGKKTKGTGKRSTAASVLETLVDEHEIIPKILEYREIAKLKGTYLDPLPLMVNPKTNRLHTTYSQVGTATGRVSSLNPNLQNIPIRTEVGREIRKGFIASEGMKLISADYSQIELRILAHITKEPALIESFRLDEDIHRRTAAGILGIPLEEVTGDQRSGAKAVNYGVLYGMGAHRLSRDKKISYDIAKDFISKYFETYPGIQGYLEQTKAFCHENGYVEDLMHRRRYIPEINSKVFMVREAAERAAINMPIQGTSAGIIKYAMIYLEPQLEEHGARMLLQVHDELVLECPTANVEVVCKIVEDTMNNAFPLDVPLGVGVGVGDTWYDAK
jgi:DNA polymerase I